LENTPKGTRRIEQYGYREDPLEASQRQTSRFRFGSHVGSMPDWLGIYECDSQKGNGKNEDCQQHHTYAYE
jgi:hypothetical protein